jgi:hypothetical protein
MCIYVPNTWPAGLVKQYGVENVGRVAIYQGRLLFLKSGYMPSVSFYLLTSFINSEGNCNADATWGTVRLYCGKADVCFMYTDIYLNRCLVLLPIKGFAF